MAGIEIEGDFLRDAVVDVATGRGVGVNGLDADAWRRWWDQPSAGGVPSVSRDRVVD